MVSWQDFVSSVEKIHKSYSVTYKNGASGQKSNGVWYCDCRGLILWALRLLGVSVSSVGTNWMIRNQMTTINRVSKASQLTVGQVVFKSRTSTANLPSKYRKGGSAYDSRFGEIDVYHVGIVVQTSPSLIIRHCTSGGIKTDTKLGAWNWAGWVKWVSSDTPDQTPASDPISAEEVQEGYTAKVIAKTGKTVNLRKTASKSSSILQRVPIGSAVTVVSEPSAAWCKIKYGTLTGYMMTDFLERG